MALTTCPECGGKVSDRAGICVHCGFVLNAEISPERKKTQVPAASKLAVLDSLDHKFDHPGFITFDRSMITGAAGSLLVFLSVFMPFASIGIIKVSQSQGSDGIIYSVLAFAALAFSFLSGLPGVITLGASAVIMAFFTVVKAVSLFGDSAPDSGLFKELRVMPQLGFYVLILGTILIIAAAVFKVLAFVNKKKES